MAKRKIDKKYEEDQVYGLNYQPEDQPQEIVGLNSSTEKEDQDDYLALNNLEEVLNKQENENDSGTILPATEELEDSKQDQMIREINESNNDGVNIPPARAARDPRKDKDPIEGEDLGLTEDHFLLSRKITPEDLKAHSDINTEHLLGSNVDNHKDFSAIFSKGASTDDSPKIDMVYNIEYNTENQHRMAAQQLLRNCYSRDNREKSNAFQVLQSMGLDEDFIKEIKSSRNAYDDDELVEIVSTYF